MVLAEKGLKCSFSLILFSHSSLLLGLEQGQLCNKVRGTEIVEDIEPIDIETLALSAMGCLILGQILGC